jgi:penicillin-binding protein 1A
VRTQIIELLGKEMFYGGGLTVITSMNTKYQEQADKSLVYGIREYDMKKGYRGPIAKISLDNWQDNLKNLPKPNGLREFELAVILSLDEKTAIIGLEDGNKASLSINDMKWTATNLTSLRKIMKVGDVVAVTNINKKGYQLRQIPAVNGAIMVMNPETGQVLALVGGYDFSASKFNRATQALRQPGSSIKPIVYLAALENGLLPTDLYEDAPSSFSQGKGMPAWKPKNYKGDFLGTITMRKALEKSRNIVTAKISERIGVERVAEIIQRFGINSKPPHYISMCLGALETTVDKMASAYSAIANGGYKVTPQYIEVIKDSNGKIIYKRDSGSCNCETGANPPVISHSPVLRLSDEASIYQITSLMEGSVQRGTSQGSKKLGKIIAGKTGTTNDSMDTWFIGFTPKITVATYIGHDTPKDLGKSATGATVALPVFVDFMSQAYKDEPSIPFKIPNSIATFKVDPVTGKRSDSEGAILEAFKVSETENIPAIEVDVKPNRTIIENDSGIY